MISNKALKIEQKWLQVRKTLSDKNKIILEILTFAFIAAHSSKSGIEVEKITKNVTLGNELNTSIIYKMTVNED